MFDLNELLSLKTKQLKLIMRLRKKNENLRDKKHDIYRHIIDDINT